MKRLGRGDVQVLVRGLERQIARAERHAEGQGVNARLVRDVGVIAGVSVTMLGIKALKVLPSIPFAPGHKLVVLTPLYVAATLLSRSRFGATLTGLTMGTVAFLMGDGRYGVFEILKHVAPGLVCDAVIPLMVRRTRRAAPDAEAAAGTAPHEERGPGAVVWSLFGGLVALGRFATIFAVTLTVQAPAVAWAFLVPGLTVHVVFGVMSGYVSHPIARAVERLRRSSDDARLHDGNGGAPTEQAAAPEDTPEAPIKDESAPPNPGGVKGPAAKEETI